MGRGGLSSGADKEKTSGGRDHRSLRPFTQPDDQVHQLVHERLVVHHLLSLGPFANGA